MRDLASRRPAGRFRAFVLSGVAVILRAMNADLGIWDKLTRIIIFLLIVAAVLGVGVWYSPVLRQNERMRKEKLDLDQKIEHEQALSKKLEESLKSMQNPRTVERLARERLSYAKSGETVVRFDATPTNPPAEPAR
jgi:cell division protein FtsB